jgi:hypothetical protein
MPRRLAVFRIDQHEQIGERLRVDGFLSRTGIQIYSDGLGGKRREYRDPTEVFHPEALSSFRAMPVTIQHPKEMVTADNWRDHSVGHVGDEVKKADDEQHVFASLWIQDSEAIQKVQAGELQELSVGYTAHLDETPGEINGERYDARQTDIRGNHVALLRSGQARGGRSVRIRLDSKGDAFLGEKMKIRINGLDFEVEDENISKALEKERADSEELLKTAEKERDQAKARADSAEDKVKDLEKKIQDVNEEQARRDRDGLIELARKFGKDLQFKDETPEEIRRKALEFKGIKLDGKSDDYILFRFEHELERLDEAPVDKVREILYDRSDNDKTEAFSIDRSWR